MEHLLVEKTNIRNYMGINMIYPVISIASCQFDYSLVIYFFVSTFLFVFIFRKILINIYLFFSVLGFYVFSGCPVFFVQFNYHTIFGDYLFAVGICISLFLFFVYWSQQQSKPR